SDSGNLTVSGNIDLNGYYLTFTGGGNTNVTGVISGSATTVNSLDAKYYTGITTGASSGVLDPTNAKWIGNQTALVTTKLTAPINFPSAQVNGFPESVPYITGNNQG